MIYQAAEILRRRRVYSHPEDASFERGMIRTSLPT